MSGFLPSTLINGMLHPGFLPSALQKKKKTQKRCASLRWLLSSSRLLNLNLKHVMFVSLVSSLKKTIENGQMSVLLFSAFQNPHLHDLMFAFLASAPKIHCRRDYACSSGLSQKPMEVDQMPVSLVFSFKYFSALNLYKLARRHSYVLGSVFR